MIGYMRAPDRFGPVSPVRRIEPYRQQDPAEREWLRIRFNLPRAERESMAYSSKVSERSASPLYDGSGKLRDGRVLEIGTRVDVYA